ncbi:MAG: phytanoyl-CoA dioxygenase family protein [Acidimicrobiales bacterium]
MFSTQEIAHFRAFGFVVRRGCFDPAEAAQLKAEVGAGIGDAFGGVGTDDDPEGTGGIRGDYLPLSVDRAPLSQALIADDPRLFQGSVELLGGPTVPTVPIATCFTSNAGWHADDGRGVGGVKFIAYLERRTAGTGALRVLPGTHEPAYQARTGEYWSRDPAGQGFDPWPVPGIALETEPGDVIAFDRHLFHSSDGGHNRLAWTIEYLPWPGLGDRDRIDLVRRVVVDAAGYDHEGYDRDRWPTWREWVAGARGIPSRECAVQRLRLLGVLGEGDPQ